MLSKATEMFDIPFRGPHQLEDDDYERVNALFDSICWFADYERKGSGLKNITSFRVPEGLSEKNFFQGWGQ